MTDNPFADPCPHCGFELDAGDIFEVWRSMKEYDKYTDEQLELPYMRYSPPRRFSHKIGIYDFEQDRTIYFECPKCEKRLP